MLVYVQCLPCHINGSSALQFYRMGITLFITETLPILEKTMILCIPSHWLYISNPSRIYQIVLLSLIKVYHCIPTISSKVFKSYVQDLHTMAKTQIYYHLITNPEKKRSYIHLYLLSLDEKWTIHSIQCTNELVNTRKGQCPGRQSCKKYFTFLSIKQIKDRVRRMKKKLYVEPCLAEMISSEASWKCASY